MDAQRFIPGDASLVEKIVNYLKAKGIFDEFRHECLADVDTKSSCQNLSQRVDGYASKFLANETWNPDLNKNELRNKLRKNIDESGMLAVGADHVVEQVINPKFYQFFLKIQETVHQYLREQTEAACKKFENVTSESSFAVSDSLEASTSKSKTVSSDPIADILSFTHPKPKPVSSSSSHKGETPQFKHLDSVKKKDESSKKKEEKTIVKEEKPSTSDVSSEASAETPVELKSPIEKIKKEMKSDESEISVDTVRKVIKEEIKSEESKNVSDSTAAEEKNSKTFVKIKDEKSSYKDDKIKHKSKNFKTSNSSNDPKKHKKDCYKDLDKYAKLKVKSSKESHSYSSAKSDRSGEAKPDYKDVSKIKQGECSTTKGFDSRKVLQKHSSKKDKDGNSKTKGNVEKSEKMKFTDEKAEKFVYEGSDASKGSKGSSQESDAEKRSSISIKKDKSKTHHHKKEHSSSKLYKDGKMSNKIAVAKDAEDSDSRSKTEKGSKLDKTKESIIEAAKISCRSNSHGSSSSVGSSSNTSKDNLSLTSDDAGVDSEKLKKKKSKEKTTCQTSKEELPPPPPPPPPSSSLELQSSEMSHEESAMSSSNFESSDENDSEKIVSESEGESCLANTSSDFHKSVSSSRLNNVSDIFMYSSSSEFEGFGTSPDKARIRESEISVSSVHTSDLSSFDDEFSDDESSDNEQVVAKKRKKKLTLKEAEKFIKNKAISKHFGRKQKRSFRCARNLTFEDNSQEIDFDSSTADEPKRSLRRERKLNPKYASSEYTSIFNSKKDTFITKQASPYPSPNKPESSDKNSEQNAFYTATSAEDDNVLSSDRAFDTSSSDEIESLRYEEKPKKTKRKALGRNKSNSSSVKRKLDDSFDNVSRKRPCSRSSVDSFNSEFATNENKPFNCDTPNVFQEKQLRSGKDFEIGLGKNSLFRKQRGPKNGDLLQKTFKNLKTKAEKD